MNLKDQNILFVLRATQHGGTENVVLQLCEILCDKVNAIVVAGGGGFQREKLKPYGAKFVEIPDIEDKNPATMLRVAGTLKRLVRQEKITVIHTHHRMAAFYVEMTGLFRQCRFINTSHNCFSNKRLLTRLAYRHADLIACGEQVKKNLESVYGLTDVAVIHNAVKPFDGKITIDADMKKARDGGGFLVGNIGRISEQKGMEYFIRAIPDVVQSHPEAAFFIVGSGEDEDRVKSMAAELHAPVAFLGYRTDIQSLMSQMDVIVLSSLWEGLPLTPIEAFSVGKSVIATAVDGTVEVVSDGENGLLVEPGNAGQIAEKICWMIEHEDERRRMERHARDTFVNGFSFDLFSRSYVDFYERL